MESTNTRKTNKEKQYELMVEGRNPVTEALKTNDNIDKPTLGPIFDTEVKSSNIFISSLVANPQRLISSSLTINFV